jgi:hypothetical protein
MFNGNKIIKIKIYIEIKKIYQFLGSIELSVKNEAKVGSPISGTCSVVKKFEGGVSGIASLRSTE